MEPAGTAETKTKNSLTLPGSCRSLAKWDRAFALYCAINLNNKSPTEFASMLFLLRKRTGRLCLPCATARVLRASA